MVDGGVQGLYIKPCFIIVFFIILSHDCAK